MMQKRYMVLMGPRRREIGSGIFVRREDEVLEAVTGNQGQLGEMIPGIIVNFC